MSNHIVTLDFESYYDQDYSLTKIQTVPYINDDRFQVHGLGIKQDAEPTEWLTEYFEINEALQEYFHEGNTNTLLAHNTMFDGLICTQKYDVRPAHYADTMAMSNGIFNGLSASLDALAERLWPDDPSMRKGTELEDSKGHVVLPPEVEAALGNYCIQDVELTYAAYNLMYDYLPEKEHALINLLIRFFTEPAILLDKPVVKDVLKRLVAHKKEIVEASGLTATQLRSRIFFPQYLEELGVTVPYKKSPTTGKDTPAFAKDDAQFQQLQADMPELEHLWKAKIEVGSTTREGRCKRLLVATVQEDLLPVPLKYSAAGTHRLGGIEKINLQNLERDGGLRQALVAPPGYLMRADDASQIEARFVCAVAGQHDQMMEFTKSDPYAGLASEIYGFEVNKYDHPIERFVGKTVKLGFGFGLGHKRLYITLNTGAQGKKVAVTMQEAEKIIKTTRGANKFVVEMWKRCNDVWLPAMKRGTDIEYGCLTITKDRIILPNGMSLRYPGLRFTPSNPEGTYGQWSYFDGRKRVKIFGGKLFENIIQALARIKTMYDMLEFDAWLLENKIGKCVHTVHDEIISLVEKDAVEESTPIISKIMRTPPSWLPEIPLDLESAIGERYEK